MAKYMQHQVKRSGVNAATRHAEGKDGQAVQSKGQLLLDFESMAPLDGPIGTPSGDRQSGNGSSTSHGVSICTAQLAPPCDPEFDAWAWRITTPPEKISPVVQFALRFAAVLETEPTARFDNSAVAALAREIFGASAGFARDAYDGAEAGMDLYLSRVGPGSRTQHGVRSQARRTGASSPQPRGPAGRYRGAGLGPMALSSTFALLGYLLDGME